MAVNPFDFLKTINETKEDLMENGVPEDSYVPFLMNRGLSYYPDTILDANEMNMLPSLDKRMQYSYLLRSVIPKKRYSKWAKKAEDPMIDAVATYYGYSRQRASEALKILSVDQVKVIIDIIKGMCDAEAK